MSESVETNSIPMRSRKKGAFIRVYGPIILGLLVIGLGLTSAYFYKKSTSNSTAATQAEVKSLVQKVSRLVVVPTDETPTIATVSDPDALKNQAFFADAKKGDKVLIYSNAKKAFLYDPEADRVVNIAPLNMEASAAQTTTATETKETKKK